MVSKFKVNERCPYCGIRYPDFRTGLRYQDVFDMLKVDDDPDPSTWTYKRRRRVLRVWCGIKKEMWEYHTDLGGCPEDPDNKNKRDLDELDFDPADFLDDAVPF